MSTRTMRLTTTLTRSGARLAVWPGALICAACAFAYSLTLQRHINGANHLQMLDVAEMQIVLASWGTLHPSGYPLYTILGNLFVMFWRGLGVPAAVASAGFSLAWGVVTLALLYRLMGELTGRILPACVATILVGLSRTFWLFASVAQTYTMNAVLVVLLLGLALRYHRQARNLDLVLLGCVTGATLVHHRTIVHLLPWLGLVVILPVVWRRRPWRAMLIGGLVLILMLGLYLYIPVRTFQGAEYQYMPVKTLDDFLYFVSQREYAPHFRFVASLAEAAERMSHSFNLWLGDLSLIGWLGGLAGLVLGSLRSTERNWFAALALSALSMMIFPLWYVDPDSMFIPLVLILAIGAGELARQAQARWPSSAWAIVGLLALVLAWLAPGNFEFVRAQSSDLSSQRLLDSAAALSKQCPVILSHWGWDLKAYQYGKIVTGQLACARIVTPNDDLRGLLRAGHSLYVADHFFYQMPVDQFRQQVGSFYPNSAGLGMIEIGKSVPTALPADVLGQPARMGQEITLWGYRLARRPGNILHLTLFWQADARPAQDYSVFVHISDKDQINGPHDIIAQADRNAPVYGWYPTSQWQAGQVIREDYGIQIPDGATPRSAAIGLYTRDASGAFYNLGVVNVPLGGQ